MKKRSKFFFEITESRRWWDCDMDGITEWTFEGRPEPELLSTKYGLTASATVTSAAYMLVYEKWTICQFEWHRGLSEFVSSLQVLQAWDFCDA